MQISELNDGEIQWITGLIDELRQLGVAGDPAALSQYLTDQRSAFFAAPVDARPDPNSIINRVGAAIGDVFVRQAGLRWVLATDEYGTEAALSGEVGEIVLYPMNAVAKRWSGDSEGSLVDYVTGVLNHVARIRTAQQHPGSAQQHPGSESR